MVTDEDTGDTAGYGGEMLGFKHLPCPPPQKAQVAASLKK